MSLVVDLLAIMALLASIVLFGLSAFFVAEIVGALLAGEETVERRADNGDCSLCVVIPAHNEEASLPATLKSVAEQCGPRDRILVVADNCHDATAARALEGRANVVERKDAERRGKGYALQFGVDQLRADPPDIVIFLDADCELGGAALARLKYKALASKQPVQALYMMRAGDESPKQAVAAFAWLLMNAVRMRGLDHLFGVTRITGAGIALPWALVETLELASGEIVEDLALTVALVDRGTPPRLAADALVTSVFPTSEKGAALQRARWEHGSLRLAAREALPLIVRGIQRGDRRAVALGIDIAIPPITVFVAALGGFFFLSIFAAGLSGLLFDAASAGRTFSSAASFSFGALWLTGLGVVIAWLSFGKDVLPLHRIGALLSFFMSKARVYGREARASTQEWTRTEREGDDA